MTCGGSEDDEDRTKRSGLSLMMSRFFEAREIIAWCIVGTAGYQVGRTCAIQPKNFSAVNPVVQDTSPPAGNGARMPAISPVMWNNRMMFRPPSARVEA